jgi:hypothetical protein
VIEKREKNGGTPTDFDARENLICLFSMMEKLKKIKKEKRKRALC